MTFNPKKKDEEEEKGRLSTRSNDQYSVQEPQPLFFPAGVFFEKQIHRPAASEHMQMRAAWVFSISCRHLHSRVCPSTSGRRGQAGLNYRDL